METGAVWNETTPICTELKNSSLSDDRERAIQACYELLCSGRPLAEILDEVKRFLDRSKGGRFDTVGDPVNATYEGSDDARTQTESRTAHRPEPTPSSAVHHSRQFSDRLAAYSFMGRSRLLRLKMIIISMVFTLVPISFSVEFSKAHQGSNDLLQDVRDQGRVISQSLLPMLNNATIDDLPWLGRQLERFASKVTTITLLLSPAGSDGERFYYAGSWPISDLETERQALARQGVLDRLTESCRDAMPFSLIDDRSTARAEIFVAVTPTSTAVGCWAVVTTVSADAFPEAHLSPREDMWMAAPMLTF